MSKKTLIMEKALTLFAREGYEGIGVQRIVTEVEVTKPTLYHYFGNKEGLLKSIYEAYFPEVLAIYQNALPFKQDYMGTIGSIIGEYVDLAKNNEAFFWLMNHLRKGPMKSESHQIVQAYHEEERAVLQTLMEQISAFHSNLQGHESQLVIYFLSLINGYIEVMIREDKIKNLNQDDCQKLTKQFLYGVFSL